MLWTRLSFLAVTGLAATGAFIVVGGVQDSPKDARSTSQRPPSSKVAAAEDEPLRLALNEAVQAAESIVDLSAKRSALVRIANAQAYLGDRESARATLRLAHQSAAKIASEMDRHFGLWRVALLFSLLNAVPLIQGALIAGFHIFTMKKLMGRQAEFADLFKGFNYFVPTLVASLVIGLFVFGGTLLCIIPGLVLAAMYKFTFLFIVDKRMDFWPAMQASHAVVKNDYFGFTMFLLLMALVNLLGFICCIIGAFVALPVTFAAITAAYKELVGFDPRTVETL